MYLNGKYLCSSGSKKEQVIEALESVGSETQIQDVLRKIVGGYGKVSSISLLPSRKKLAPNEYKFLVIFDSILDAMNAAEELGCLKVGNSALVVSVLRNGQYADRITFQLPCQHLQKRPTWS